MIKPIERTVNKMLTEYIESSQMIGDERIVGLETIIPTLYKYYIYYEISR